MELLIFLFDSHFNGADLIALGLILLLAVIVEAWRSTRGNVPPVAADAAFMRDNVVTLVDFKVNSGYRTSDDQRRLYELAMPQRRRWPWDADADLSGVEWWVPAALYPKGAASA
jgi:hypothetical protein